ncbi:MAG: DUF1259 domain-containing protein [Deltaproteobacteria bacterium]|nr:DUF1259 domain-containing protein [Deltaproteobacteria bacterium]
MKNTRLVPLFLLLSAHALAASEGLDPAALAKASGFQGQADVKAGTYKISLPRSGLGVAVGGVTVPSAMGLTALASFMGTKEKTVFVGKVPLRENEVNGALSEALHAGFDVTSLHNTFLWDSPRAMSLHFSGSGKQDAVASAVGAFLRKCLAGGFASAKASAVKLDLRRNALDLKIIHRLLWKGELEGGVYKISTGRGTELDGKEVGESMGVESWASFAGTTERAVVSGDLAMLEFEMKDVLKALIEARINVVSIHTHFIRETPRIMFVHYWGTGPLEKLADGLRAALYAQKNFRGSQ